jgi:hypothetical protein
VARGSAEVLLGSSKVWARELKFWYPPQFVPRTTVSRLSRSEQCRTKPSLFLFLNDILSSYVFNDSLVVEEEMAEIL